MPEFTVKEVRLPELHLPEVKRDEIIRSLSGVRLPEVDLARARRGAIKLPIVTVTGSDIGKLVAAGAAIARFARPMPGRPVPLVGRLGRRPRSPLVRIVQPRRRRARWPYALGAFLIAVLGAWVVLRRPSVRQRIDAATRDVRRRLDEWRSEIRSEFDAAESIETAQDVVATDESGPGAVVVAAGISPSEVSPNT
jgi:hypothetical protein